MIFTYLNYMFKNAFVFMKEQMRNLKQNGIDIFQYLIIKNINNDNNEQEKDGGKEKEIKSLTDAFNKKKRSVQRLRIAEKEYTIAKNEVYKIDNNDDNNLKEKELVEMLKKIEKGAYQKYLYRIKQLEDLKHQISDFKNK